MRCCEDLLNQSQHIHNFIHMQTTQQILTFSFSTTISEQVFSTMKLVKIRFRNKIEDEFLANSLIIHIEKDIVKNFDYDSIIDDFKSLKER